MPIPLTPFDPAEYLTDPVDQAALIADAEASGDPIYVDHARVIVGRAASRTPAVNAE